MFAALLLGPFGGVLDSLATLVPRTIPPVELPRDEGAHTEPMEWWYFGSHLSAGPGSTGRYGFELTLVRIGDPLFGVGLRFLGYGAVIDLRRRTYRADDRIGPISAYEPAPGGFRVRLPPPEDDHGPWTVRAAAADGKASRYDLAYVADGAEVRLALSARKPPLMHHGDGVADFGDGFRMGYYSRTRLGVTGSVAAEDGRVGVTGSAWMDHQWGPAGFFSRRWKFFAIQLESGEDLVVYEAWPRASSSPLRCYAALVEADGRVVSLVDWQQTRYTQQPPHTLVLTDANAPLFGVYPVHNRIMVRGLEEIDLRVTPYVGDQRRRPRVSHASYPVWWEGVCKVVGTLRGRPVQGRAMMELAGWDGAWT